MLSISLGKATTLGNVIITQYNTILIFYLKTRKTGEKNVKENCKKVKTRRNRGRKDKITRKKREQKQNKKKNKGGTFHFI